MPDNFTVVENFLPDLDGFREEALKHPFIDVWSGGEIFRNIQVRDAQENQSLMESTTGRKIARAFQWIICSPARGTTPPRIHTDEELGDVEAVVYLNRPEDCIGGMALWRHRKTGLEKRPTMHDCRRLGKSPVRLYGQLWEDRGDESKWDLVGMSDMKTNRLVYYPAECFHSRHPFDGFGTTPQDSRLIWVSFFKWAQNFVEEQDAPPRLFLGAEVGR